ncbi:hypothetical protein WQ54_27060 [Bacillus sp. SA1-12]|uniref:hypothetical protein n=1 Tax=Bacillus sp. SA1-12 TaxID=1455638 RepID=UPI0006272B4E|nr:hypothetical protein [Bacillus sp. SA1-12]KKI89229.1 hypothetical protein WQ54_27060 [Bacillus sp. SA1-12]
MVSLTNDQYEMLHFYYHLLNTIEEGFEYVIESFSNLELTEGENLFKDILSAFYHIDSSHLTLCAFLEEETGMVGEIRKFDQVILTLEGEPAIFTTIEQHYEFVKNQLFPAFLAWKEMVQAKLQPYITHEKTR